MPLVEEETYRFDRFVLDPVERTGRQYRWGEVSLGRSVSNHVFQSGFAVVVGNSTSRLAVTLPICSLSVLTTNSRHP
jgi:hypothetical protein